MPITINGTTGIAGVDGSAGTPAVQGTDTNTGVFYPAADTVGISTGGSERLRVASAGQVGIGGANYGTTGQVMTSAGASAAPTWSDVGMTLLGTLTTTSGASQSLNVTLTGYKQLVLVFRGVSHNSGTSQSFLLGTSTADDVIITNNFVAASTLFGFVFVDLFAGTVSAMTADATTTTTTTQQTYSGGVPITTASTTVSVAPTAGAFDAGTIRVYGVN